ncbi:MAG: hypothetical protein ACTSSO_03495 [Candidatus Hodarchaeales archaeon]
MSLEEKLKSLENTKDYSEMVNQLRQNESLLTSWYAKLSSLLLEERPQIAGMLQSLEELSITTTTLLRKCTMLLDDEYSPVPADILASTTIGTPPPDTVVRDRDDVFSISSLKSIQQSLPAKEVSPGNEQALKVWYIAGGQNECIELSFPDNKYFNDVIIAALSKIEGLNDNEEFSISPLGYDPILVAQFESSINQIISSFTNEFTLIKFYR